MAKAQAEIKGADGLFLAGFKAGTDFCIDYLANHHEPYNLQDVDPKTYYAVCLDIQRKLSQAAYDKHKEYFELALKYAE